MKLATCLLMSLTLLVSVVPASAATLTVNGIYDNLASRDQNPGDGVCLDYNGVCSLRAAIMEANALASPPHTITFSAELDLSVNSDNQIGALPALSQAITIDASSVWVGGSAQRPGVKIGGALGYSNFNGLEISAEGCALYGISVVSFGNNGILVTSANNTIGGTGVGQRCVIGANDGAGISFYGGSATNNAVRGCYIGVSDDGQYAWANGHGISLLDGASANLIGGTTPGEGNYISGNTGMGIQVFGMGTLDNRISDNLIGIAPGPVIMPNGSDGIRIYSLANATTVGGNATVDYPLRPNWIASNGGNGIYLVNAGYGVTTCRNVVYNNIIQDNGQCGITLEDSSGVHIIDNHISNNLTHGVLVWAHTSVANENFIYRNVIHDNRGKGISLQGGANNGIVRPFITAHAPGLVAGVARDSALLEPSNMVQIFSDNGRQGGAYEGAVAVSGEQWSYAGSPAGPYITVLASDNQGNTSEFGYISEPPGMVNLLLNR